MMSRANLLVTLGGVIAVIACADALSPLPHAGDKFVLKSVGGAPLPVDAGGAALTVAETLVFLPSSAAERVVQHRLVTESAGGRQLTVSQITYALTDNGVTMELRCPINANCTFSVIQGHVINGELVFDSPDGKPPTRIYDPVAH